MSTRPLSELDPEMCSIDGAEGMCFDCPVCAGPRAHSILVTFEPPSPFPSGAIWQLVDANLATLTVSPSINCAAEEGACTFHGWVKNGQVTW